MKISLKISVLDCYYQNVGLSPGEDGDEVDDPEKVVLYEGI